MPLRPLAPPLTQGPKTLTLPLFPHNALPTFAFSSPIYPDVNAKKGRYKFNRRIQNRSSNLSDEVEDNVEAANYKLDKIVMEVALYIKGTAPEKGMASFQGKNTIKKHQDIIVRTKRDEIELAELIKVIQNRKVRNISKFNMGKIEVTLRNRLSLKTTRRRLGFGMHQLLFALKNANSNVTTNLEDMIKAAGKLCAE